MFDSISKSYKTHWYFPNQFNDHDDSHLCSPPLWRTSPSGSPHHRQNSYRSLSPASKAQAIARGQRELMEMVSKMPESCYELSLKDLVEANANHDDREVFDEIPQRRNREKMRKIKSDKKVTMNQNGSINNGGFLLKMVFPVNLGSKKKKKKKKKDDSLVTSNCSKASPRPSASDGSMKIDVKDWWKKRVSESGESESGVSSTNSGSIKSSGSSSSSSNSGRRNRSSVRNRSGGCWSFIRNLHFRQKTY